MKNNHITTEIPVELSATQGSTGNLFDLTDAINKELDPGDYIQKVSLIGHIPGVSWEDIPGISIGIKNFGQVSVRKLILRGAKDKKLVFDYNTNTGSCEVSLNEFKVSELPILRLMVARYNPNRHPIAK